MTVAFNFFRLTTAIAALTASDLSEAQLSESVAEKLAAWGVPTIEIMYPLDTGISGDVHSLATLSGGELAVLTSNRLNVFDGTQWTSMEGVGWAYQVVHLAGERMVLANDQGLVELTPNDTGGYSRRTLTPPESMQGLYSLMSVAEARGSLFGIRGSDVVEIDGAGDIHRYKLPNWSNAVFSIEDELYFIGGTESALNRWDWETKKAVPLSEQLEAFSYEWLVQVKPRAAGGVWMLTETNRIVGFDGTRAWIWPGSKTLADRSVQVKDFVETKPETIAVGTSSQGVLLFEEDGNLMRQVSKEQGLDAVSVIKLGVDAQQGLWVATKRSLSRLSLDIQTLVFDERHGLTETVNALAFFRDRIYLATSAGLFASNPDAESMDTLFTLVESSRNVADLFVYDGHLFIAAGSTMAMNEAGQIYTIDVDGGSSFWQPSNFPGLILAGNYKGVASYRKIGERWTKTESLPGLTHEIFSLTESSDGIIWGGMGDDHVARIRLAKDGKHQVDSMKIPASMNGSWSMATRVEGDVYINSAPCVRWDTKKQEWVEDPSMIYSPGSAPLGFEHVYGRSGDEAFVCLNARRGETVPRPTRRLIGVISGIGKSIDTRGTSIAYDSHGDAWIGGRFGLIRATSPLEEVKPIEFPPDIHRLTSMKDGVKLPIPDSYGTPLTLRPEQNSLRIEVEFHNFASSRSNQYQIFVEGLDEIWEDYSRVSFRDLTNLEPGDYVIRVQARTSTGQASPTLDIPITLLAPWYEQPWAYFLYALGAVFLVFGIVTFASKQHVRRAQQLQQLVQERTQEVVTKNDVLKRQAEILENQNLELAEKTDELEATTESLTETLHQLQEAQEQLVSTARTAGKAEIATNVLHNVGNVLNSVNVSLRTLSQKVENSNLPKLTRLATLVEEQKRDLHHFLAIDERGRHFPDYLARLAAVLSNESTAIAREIALMEEEVEHIKRIVTAQQTHAKSSSVFEDVNLHELCNTAFAMLGDSGFATVNEVPKNLTLHTDKHRLLEIIINLVSNARDAINTRERSEGKIVATAHQLADGDGIALSIVDNGEGIDPDTQPMLFRHGFTTRKEGHGFGLHSAANAAKSLGGNIALSSSGLGLGAEAKLTMPKRARSLTARSDRSSSATSIGT